MRRAVSSTVLVDRSDKSENTRSPLKRTIVRAMGRVVCLVGIAAANGQAAQQQRPQLAEEVFKNVQIIKGIPVDEFMDTMGMFAAATNMNCVDCHTSDSTESWENFAKETPLKQTARRMLLMVDAINKQNFKGVRSVTCYTCHHGDRRPKQIPSLVVQYSAPIEDPNEIDVFSNAGGLSADQIFAKYLQALGAPSGSRVSRVSSLRGRIRDTTRTKQKPPSKSMPKLPPSGQRSFMPPSGTVCEFMTAARLGSHLQINPCP